MSAFGHTIDPMSGRQHANASERTISGARVTRPVVPSRGFDVEAGTEDRVRAADCERLFRDRMAARFASRDADLDAPWTLTARVLVVVAVLSILGVAACLVFA